MAVHACSVEASNELNRRICQDLAAGRGRQDIARVNSRPVCGAGYRHVEKFRPLNKPNRDQHKDESHEITHPPLSTVRARWLNCRWRWRRFRSRRIDHDRFTVLMPLHHLRCWELSSRLSVGSMHGVCRSIGICANGQNLRRSPTSHSKYNSKKLSLVRIRTTMRARAHGPSATARLRSPHNFSVIGWQRISCGRAC